MQLLPSLVAWLSLGSQGAFAYALASSPTRAGLAVRAVDVKAAAKSIQPLLSKNAEVIFPNDDDWAKAQIRDSGPRIQPKYNVIIKVATEADVQNTISTAYKHGIPYLAVSGTHGWTKTLNNLPFGIQINMRKMNATTIDAGGKTATIQGGTLQYEATRALFKKNKQAVTGLCECVSIIGPLMGGGHSLLQNRHGYSLDNIVSARVVIGNGTTVTASATSHPDLFWALRGAGHNFGVVTSMVMDIYDIQRNWTIYNFIYTQDKIETLFPLINVAENNASRPTNLAYNGVITRIAPIDPANPVIVYTVHYEGPKSESDQWAAPFQALGPAVTEVYENVDYIQLYNVTQNSLDSVACRSNMNVMGSGASLPEWNATAARAAYIIFSELTADSRYNTSVLLLENYGMTGVRAINPNDTSLSLEERQYPIIANPTIWWNGNKSQDTLDAYAYGEKIRQAWFSGMTPTAKKHTYVNYAIGTENFNQMYGYESWRVKKLKGLKSAWDPQDKFAYYNPVPLS